MEIKVPSLVKEEKPIETLSTEVELIEKQNQLLDFQAELSAKAEYLARIEQASRESMLRERRPTGLNNIAHWSIFPLDSERIEARNNRSGEIFQGTVADFNEIIRGA